MPTDILHVHRPPIIELAYFAARRGNAGLLRRVAGRLNRLSGSPSILTDHGLFVQPTTVSRLDLTWFMELVLEQYDDVVCVDRPGYQYAMSLKRGNESSVRARIHYLPQAIDTDLFRQVTMPDGKELVVGYAGRWARDGMFLLKALVESELPGIRFAISGGATEEDIRRLGPVFSRPNVTLCPNILRLEDLYKFYAGIHLLVDFYRGAGTGRSVLEAMAVGRPVLRIRSTDTHPVCDGVNGILVEPDPKAIAMVLQDLVGRRDLLVDWGQRARESIDREFRSDLVMAQMERIYRHSLRVAS